MSSFSDLVEDGEKLFSLSTRTGILLLVLLCVLRLTEGVETTEVVVSPDTSGTCSLPDREVHEGMVSKSLDASVFRLVVSDGERTCETLADFSVKRNQQWSVLITSSSDFIMKHTVCMRARRSSTYRPIGICHGVASCASDVGVGGNHSLEQFLDVLGHLPAPYPFAFHLQETKCDMSVQP